ncbi:MAG: HAD family hydrolase [Bryobacteraceae bacterium]
MGHPRSGTVPGSSSGAVPGPPTRQYPSSDPFSHPHLCRKTQFIDATTSADDVAVPKPAPEIFRSAMEAGGVDPSRAIAVGDSVWDIQAARAAGIGCLAVESGGSSQHELAEAGALHVYRDVGEILDQLLVGPLRSLLR